MKKILIVEDEKNISELLKFNLTKAGYDAEIAEDGGTAVDMALSGSFDLVLLDLMLPVMNGYEVCKAVREKSNVPIIMLTAREDEADKVLGLDVGADDYVTKPFSLSELLARINSNIRRATMDVVGGRLVSGRLIVGNLVIDDERYLVIRDGKEIELTKKEYELIVFLARNLGQAFPREKILEEVWGYDGLYGDARTVDQTIMRLRAKIEKNPAAPEHIMTRRGIGFYLQ